MKRHFLIWIAACFPFMSVAQDHGRPEPWVPTDGATISFEVLRKGKPFGDHILTFATSPNGDLKVTTDVDLKAGLGPITVFRYALDSVETWRDGALIALSGRTNEDGDEVGVVAERQGEAILVNGSSYSGYASVNIIPSSHWNIRQMFGEEMLSTEDGELLDIEVEELGREAVEVADTAISATRYRLSSDIDVDLWYDDAGRWVKLAFEIRGQNIEYRLRELY